MFRKNYHFEGTQDCGRILHFYKMGITRKEAKVYAKYLIGQYNCKLVEYYTMGKIMREKRVT
jgi:hypothetical protein